MRRLITAAVLLAALPVAAPAQQPAPTDRRADALAKLMAADTNKDGKWDKAEWLAAGRRERGFDFLDADRDGFVTLPELKTGMERARALGFGGPN